MMLAIWDLYKMVKILYGIFYVGIYMMVKNKMVKIFWCMYINVWWLNKMITSNICYNKYLMFNIKMVNNNKMVKIRWLKILNIWWL